MVDGMSTIVSSANNHGRGVENHHKQPTKQDFTQRSLCFQFGDGVGRMSSFTSFFPQTDGQIKCSNPLEASRTCLL